MDTYDSRSLLTAEQIAFIHDVDNFCQAIFGFSVGKYLAYSENWIYVKSLFLVAVCPKYQLWPSNTLMNKFYVYIGDSESVANETAEHYKQEGYDVCIRDDLNSYISAPEKPIVITSSFFEDLTEKIDFLKLDRIKILIHEGFHAYVHHYDIGFENYSNYLTIQEMLAEETTATFIGQLAQIEYLLYKKESDEQLMAEALNDFKQLSEYYYLDECYQKLNNVYNNVKLDEEQKEKKKQKILLKFEQNNNANLLIYCLYYGNQFTRKYFKMFKGINNGEVMRTIVKQFVEAYWKKHQ